MASSELRIARLTRRATWRAVAANEDVGEANAMLRPDRRWFVSVDTWNASSFLPLISADAVDEDGLRTLDECLREDVPGMDGWIHDPREFREQTFEERRFDPATYLVAAWMY